MKASEIIKKKDGDDKKKGVGNKLMEWISKHKNTKAAKKD